MKSLVLTLFLLVPAAAWAFDANGVALGAAERDIRRAFPSAHCKELEWKSNAASRRCDDSKVPMAGTTVRVTFYLKNDAVQAFDLRFDAKDAPQVAKFLKSQYGEPTSEARQTVEQREIYKVLWDKGRERAVLVAQSKSGRGSVLASRGNFEEEIYRVR